MVWVLLIQRSANTPDTQLCQLVLLDYLAKESRNLILEKDINKIYGAVLGEAYLNGEVQILLRVFPQRKYCFYCFPVLFLLI